ncbi:TetR/AcrR family transcriptional regulator [Corynebacterium variabile]|uniref:TetR/AcrR family transcriptional regulator n=1 Tax=Corynebacterium variabile TaxID=1727 RepID=UPI00289ED1FD|nr:helix-turn-helix domain-containing protein [Corynebacterium variabile]
MAGTRTAATVAAIRTAALELATAHGYQQTTVDRICERAGVSQRTFFNHFPTKQDAFLDHATPCLDEKATRGFLVGTGPLLDDALAMITLPGAEDIARMRIVTSCPELLAAHVARMDAVADEIRELVLLRLRRDRTGTDSEQEQDAAMVACLLAGVVRWGALNTASPASSAPCPVTAARACLDRITSTDTRTNQE